MIRISRGDAYVAGDMIIQLFIDGKKAGSLIGAKPLELELPAGLYAVQARMPGIHRGETIVVPVHDPAGTLDITVSGTRPGLVNNVAAVLIWLAVLALPDRGALLLTAKILGVALICGISLYRRRKMKPQLLRLSVFEEITSGSRASSIPLS